MLSVATYYYIKFHWIKLRQCKASPSKRILPQGPSKYERNYILIIYNTTSDDAADVACMH